MFLQILVLEMLFRECLLMYAGQNQKEGYSKKQNITGGGRAQVSSSYVKEVVFYVGLCPNYFSGIFHVE